MGPGGDGLTGPCFCATTAPMTWTGKTALVTGAASGIGQKFAETLARAGYRLFLLDISRTGLDETAAKLEAIGKEAAPVRTIVVDIASDDAVREAVSALDRSISSLDLLVNCAAILGDGRFSDQPVKDFAKVIQVDLMGTVHMIHATLPWLRAARGNVIIMASTASLHGWPMLAAYSAAKGAIENYSEAIRAELARDGVGITTVFPLLVDTPLLQRGELPPILKGRRVSAAEVVDRSLEGAEARRSRVYVPWTARLVALVHGVAPPLLDWWGARTDMGRLPTKSTHPSS